MFNHFGCKAKLWYIHSVSVPMISTWTFRCIRWAINEKVCLQKYIIALHDALINGWDQHIINIYMVNLMFVSVPGYIEYYWCTIYKIFIVMLMTISHIFRLLFNYYACEARLLFECLWCKAKLLFKHLECQARLLFNYGCQARFLFLCCGAK